MRGRQRVNRGNKKAKWEWDTGDLNDRDSELFKHLPSPGEVTGGLNATKELPKVKIRQPKKRVKKG